MLLLAPVAPIAELVAPSALHDAHSRPDAGSARIALIQAARPITDERTVLPGQIALHGDANLGGALGTAVSRGRIRPGTAAITWLAWHIRTGAPVAVD